jgi:hypothetical protein
MIVNVIRIAELPPKSPGHPVPSPKSVISRKIGDIQTEMCGKGAAITPE